MLKSLARPFTALVVVIALAACAAPQPPIVQTPPPSPTLPPPPTAEPTATPRPTPSTAQDASSSRPVDSPEPLPAVIAPIADLGYECSAGAERVACRADLAGAEAQLTVVLAGERVDDVTLILIGPDALASSVASFSDVVNLLAPVGPLRDSFISYIADMAGRGATATLPDGVAIRLNGGPEASISPDSASLELIDLAAFGG